jgi:hypothetical protein
MAKFGEADWGRRVRLHNTPEDRLKDETGVLLGPHPFEEFKVVV